MPSKEIQKILIIDDEPNTRTFILNLLASHGYHPILAENRIEGLQKAMAEQPKVIIIDMMMPGKGGMQLYRDLKRNEKLKKVPVIMLSTIEQKTFFKLQGVGWSRSEQALPGSQVYLRKPHETEELLKILQKLSRTQGAKPNGLYQGGTHDD